MFSFEEWVDFSKRPYNQQSKPLPEQDTPGRIISIMKAERAGSHANVGGKLWFQFLFSRLSLELEGFVSNNIHINDFIPLFYEFVS